MNTSKTRTGIGKKILSVMSAAIIGLSTLGGIKATDTTASAMSTSSVYYDAGTFIVGDNHKITGKVTSKVNGTYSLSDAIVTDVLKPYETDESSVAFKGGETYIYVAKGIPSGNNITWTVYASPAKNTNKLNADNLTDADEAKSAYENFGKNTGLTWNEKQYAKGTGDLNDPWITITTHPFNGKDDDKGYVTLTRHRTDENPKQKSVDGKEDDLFQLGVKDKNNPDSFINDPDSFINDRVMGLYSGHAGAISSDKSSDKYPLVDDKNTLLEADTFAKLIKDYVKDGKATSEYPTFAIPLMIREFWLDTIPFLIEEQETGTDKSAVTGFRLDDMVAESTCAAGETLPNEYGDGHIYEFATDPDKKGSLTGYTSNPIHFVADTIDGERVTTITPKSTKGGSNIIYSENSLLSALDATDAGLLTKVNNIKDHGLTTKNATELCNTRISMVTKVNATYSYSTDRPRLTGTFNSTIPGSPKIVSTLATNAASSAGKTIALGKSVTFNDRVNVSGLVVGTTYRLTTTVADPATGSTYNDIAAVTTSFKATGTSTLVDVSIKLDTTKYEGKKLVVFETLYTSDGKTVLDTHADKSDTDQTVTVASADDPTIPSNKSIATDKINETHTMTYSPNAVIKNKVPYTNLTVGKKYTVTSTTYDISTGKQVLSPVSKTFTADSTGYVEVEIPVNSVIYTGKTFSVLASISDGNAVVCSYDDMTDKDTQVMFPTVATVLTASNRTSKTVAAMNSVEVADLVRYTGLTPGRTYKVTGYILHKEKSPGSIDSPIITGAEGSAVANDIKIVASKIVEFTPMTSDGSVTVVFNVNAADLSGQHLVAVETIADGPTNVIVGEHKDINDANQTVAVKSGNNVYTGGNDMTVTFTIIAIVCSVAAVGFGTLMFIRKRRADK